MFAEARGRKWFKLMLGWGEVLSIKVLGLLLGFFISVTQAFLLPFLVKNHNP